MSVRSSRSSHSRRHGLFRRKAPSSFMAEADSPLRRPGPPRRMALSSLMAVSECIDTQQQVTKVTCSSRGSPSRGFGVPLQLTDRESGITVCLVSTMRYNPTSILRVVGTVDDSKFKANAVNEEDSGRDCATTRGWRKGWGGWLWGRVY